MAFPTAPLNRPLRIAFLGTPEFAAICCAALLDGPHEIVGCVTAPDRPAGRGHKLQPTAVKVLAVEHGLPLLQPEKLRDPEFLAAFAAWKPDVAVVVAFRMLPEAVWSLPPFGTINLHASLLPQLRGAAPIQRAIMYGMSSTGVTTFALQHEIDTGAVLRAQRLDIGPNETAGELHDRLLAAGTALLADTLNALANGSLTATPQEALLPSDPLLEAPKLFRDDCRINWHALSARVHDHVRGLAPFPTAWTPGPEGPIKVLSGKMVTSPGSADPGTWRAHNGTVQVRCHDGWYEITALKPPGKRLLSGAEWLNGHQGDLPEGWNEAISGQS
jgi:methionyl-tRNA formyltransferase